MKHWIIPVRAKIEAEDIQKNHPSIVRGAERNKRGQQSAPIEKDKSKKNVFQKRWVRQCQVRDNHSPWYLLKKNVYKNVERANSWKDVETMSSGDTQLGICQQQGDAQPHKHS